MHSSRLWLYPILTVSFFSICFQLHSLFSACLLFPEPHLNSLGAWPLPKDDANLGLCLSACILIFKCATKAIHGLRLLCSSFHSYLDNPQLSTWGGALPLSDRALTVRIATLLPMQWRFVLHREVTSKFSYFSTTLKELYFAEIFRNAKCSLFPLLRGVSSQLSWQSCLWRPLESALLRLLSFVAGFLLKG